MSYVYSAPQLRLGQVFKVNGKTLVCLRVSDCSARVLEVSQDQINDEDRQFDEFDRLGYRITACPELSPEDLVCIIPRTRIKVRATAFKPGRERVLGEAVYVPIPMGETSSSLRKGKRKLFVVTERPNLVGAFTLSARIVCGMLRR